MRRPPRVGQPLGRKLAAALPREVVRQRRVARLDLHRHALAPVRAERRVLRVGDVDDRGDPGAEGSVDVPVVAKKLVHRPRVLGAETRDAREHVMVRSHARGGGRSRGLSPLQRFSAPFPEVRVVLAGGRERVLGGSAVARARRAPSLATRVDDDGSRWRRVVGRRRIIGRGGVNAGRGRAEGGRRDRERRAGERVRRARHRREEEEEDERGGDDRERRRAARAGASARRVLGAPREQARALPVLVDRAPRRRGPSRPVAHRAGLRRPTPRETSRGGTLERTDRVRAAPRAVRATAGSARGGARDADE